MLASREDDDAEEEGGNDIAGGKEWGNGDDKEGKGLLPLPPAPKDDLFAADTRGAPSAV